MKEQFVTFEIAVALRELGFDAYCFASIDKTGVPYIPSKGGRFKNSEGPTVACPLWQQAFYFILTKLNLEKDENNSYALTFDGEFSLEVRQWFAHEGYSIAEVATGNCNTFLKLLELAEQV